MGSIPTQVLRFFPRKKKSQDLYTSAIYSNYSPLVAIFLDLQQAILLMYPTLSVVAPLILLLVYLLVRRVMDVQLSCLVPITALNSLSSM